MKRLLIVFALLIGLVGISHAVDRRYQGWNVTVATGVHTEIFSGRGYVKAIINSFANYNSADTQEYSQLFSTDPGKSPGAGVGTFGSLLFVATAAVTPPLVFNTTVTIVSGGFPLPNSIDFGSCDTCFLEIDSTGGLYLRKSIQASGGTGQTAVYWSK